MVQRPAPYHKLKNGVKFKLKPTASQELTKEKDENTYGTFSHTVLHVFAMCNYHGMSDSKTR